MTWSPASGRPEIEAQLRRIGGQSDGEIDIAGAALLLAALDRPRVPFGRYHHHLSLLARDTADLGRAHGAAESLRGRVEALNEVLFGRYGYAGDVLTYDDTQNANLMRVIDRRKGLPVALGILTLHAARAQGWQIEGLNFPGHFLLRLTLGGARAIVDPFNKGAQRGPRELRELLRSLSGSGGEGRDEGGDEVKLALEHTAPVSNREVLLRLQNNIKLRRLHGRRWEDGLAILESMLMIAPDHAELWREAGILHAELDNLRAASLALENYAELARAPDQRHEAASLLQKVKARLN